MLAGSPLPASSGCRRNLGRKELQKQTALLEQQHALLQQQNSLLQQQDAVTAPGTALGSSVQPAYTADALAHDWSQYYRQPESVRKAAKAAGWKWQPTQGWFWPKRAWPRKTLPPPGPPRTSSRKRARAAFAT